MNWKKASATVAVLMGVGALTAGCGDMFKSGGGDAADESSAVDAEGEASDASESEETTPTPEPEEAAAPAFVGEWVEETGDTVDIRADGSVHTNEASLPTGSWEEDATGRLLITFSGRATMQLRGRMDGDDLILVLPNGEEGRFTRTGSGGSSSSGGSGGSSGGKPN